MFGGTPARNMVNLTDKLPTLPPKGPDWDKPDEAKAWCDRWALWKADLGSRSYTQPVVAGGKVFVGTNNERPRNPRDTAKNKNGEVEPLDKGVLMCFDALTGKFLWQAVFGSLEAGGVNDWPKVGLCSSPTVEGNPAYFVSNRCTVVCADVEGRWNGVQGPVRKGYTDPTDADILWQYDMRKELGVFPHCMSVGCPIIVGDLLFTVTANGVDDGHINVPAPEAPSFICLNKNTGKLVWKDNSPGKNILHGQWAQPAYAAGPVPQVIFPGGDGWIRALDPPTGRLLWKFDGNPKDAVHELGGVGTKSEFIAAPVIHDGRLYLGVGQDPERSDGIGRLWCLDLTKAVAGGVRNSDRDVSPELIVRVEKRPNEADRVVTKPNPDSAAIWMYGGKENRPWAIRDFKFGRTMSNATIVGDILYIGELPGFFHCMNAKTGEHYWQYDIQAQIWGSPYYVDGRIIFGTDNGDLYVFRHDPKPEKIDDLGFQANTQEEARVKRRERQKQVTDRYLVSKIEFDAIIRNTPSVAGGVLYLATEKTLFAIGRPPPR